ncbi:tetratricopeptide repeat protein [Planctomicrobium sp. SH527]|uniref:tetratricopeptide repeat protein n=1 Tax=Planctomicrobium sp. SH527 TaxID=3448123 RepID=UPI003F5B1B66
MSDHFQNLLQQLNKSKWPALIVSGMVIGSGCGSLKLSRQEQVRAEMDKNPSYSIAGVQGPTERSLNQSNWDRKREDLKRGGDPETIAALEEFDAAKELYDAGKYKEAEKGFQRLAKERRQRYESFGARFRRNLGMEDKRPHDMYGNYGDAIEEDAIFMLAESQYAQRHYADAQETYEDLLVRYPSTRYLDPTTRQMFRIARYWLGFPEESTQTGENGEVKVASAESAERNGGPSTLSRVPVFPNLTDKSRPTFDTAGRGKQALRSIWLHDSTGPLAPDALMLAANHALRTDDYVEARRLYTLLREQYPDSIHLKDAYMLGSHVALASYQGAAYDDEALTSARELKQELLAIFPSLTEDERGELEQEIGILKDAEVARIWDLVDFYRVKRNNPGVKLHCYQIINKYPDSPYAPKARELLLEIQEEEKRWANSPLNFKKKKVAATPAAPESQQPQQQPPAQSQQTPVEPRQPAGIEPLPAPAAEPNWLQRMNPLRSVKEPPKLEKVPENPPPTRKDDLAEKPGKSKILQSGF